MFIDIIRIKISGRQATDTYCLVNLGWLLLLGSLPKMFLEPFPDKVCAYTYRPPPHTHTHTCTHMHTHTYTHCDVACALACVDGWQRCMFVPCSSDPAVALLDDDGPDFLRKLWREILDITAVLYHCPCCESWHHSNTLPLPVL